MVGVRVAVNQSPVTAVVNSIDRQTFPDPDVSAVHQVKFLLFITSDEGLENVGDEINLWASGDVY